MALIRIATRNSPLALWQANFVRDQLILNHPDLEVEIIGMTTQGDQLLDRSLTKVGGKGLFLKELEVSLLNRETDIAVHSMKDVPVTLPKGLEIAVLCEREDPRDAFVSNNYQNLYALPQGAKVGTSSLRRVSQLKRAFPALQFIELRGNVNTRLAKLDSGEYDAIILAAAGLIRLGFVERIKQYITPELCLPAVGQGIVGVECRSDDEQTKSILAALHNRESALVLAAERSMNQQLEGGCQVPVAGYAEILKGKISMRGMVGAVDGSKVLMSSMIGEELSLTGASNLGEQVAQDLARQGATEILEAVHRESTEKALLPNKPVVLLTRQRRYLGNMEAILNRLDYRPVHLPTLAIEPGQDPEALERIAKLGDYTDVVFVSRNAVEIGMQLIKQGSGMPPSIRTLAVGTETAKQLYKHGIDAMYPDNGAGAEALLRVSQLADLSGRKMLIVRGSNGLDWPAEVMRERGAKVDTAVVYRQTQPSDSRAKLRALLKNNPKIEGVFAHSAESVMNLISMAGDEMSSLLGSTIVVGSARIGETAKEHGWRGTILVAESPSNKHMMITFSK